MSTKQITSNILMSSRPALFLGIFSMLAIFVGAPSRAASSNTRSDGGSLANLSAITTASVLASAAIMPVQAPPAETVELFESDCATPRAGNEFNVGETICVKVTNAPTFALFPLRRIAIVNVAGHILAQTDVLAPTQTFNFPIPSTVTAADGLDVRGGWSANSIATSDASVRAQEAFTVREPGAGNDAADLFVYSAVDGGDSVVAAGEYLNYVVLVVNRGPDPALNVVLTKLGPVLSDENAPAPTLTSWIQRPTGPQFNCPANTTACSISSMPARSVAIFDVIYRVHGNTPEFTKIKDTSSVISDTEDPREADNSSSAFSIVQGVAAGVPCELRCPADIVVTAPDASGTNVKFSAASVTGDCGSVSNNPGSGSFFTVGIHTITSTATNPGSDGDLGTADDSAAGSCTFKVTVLSSNPPTITCPSSVVVEADAGQDYASGVTVGSPMTTPTVAQGATVVGVRSDGTNATYDEFGNIETPAFTPALDAPYPVGITGIIWTVTDAAGRSKSCRQRIVVKSSCGAGDIQPPTFSTPPVNITVFTGADNTGCTVALDDDELGNVEVADNCSATFSISGLPPANEFPIGSTTLTYTARDSAGNPNTGPPVTQVVTVIDNTPPRIKAPANASYTCLSEVPDASPSQATRGDVLDENGNLLPPGLPFDNCVVPVVTFTEASTGAGTFASPRVITRTFKATDAAGNFSTHDQVITVTDPTAPTLNVPADITVSNDPGSCTAVVSFTVTGSDNCNADGVNVQTSHASGSAFPKGTTQVTATATDWAGNVTTKTFNVTVNDTEFPTIAVAFPAPGIANPDGSGVTVYLDPNSSATSKQVFYTVTPADNCPGVTLGVSPATGSVFDVGTTIVTATATDASGNPTVRPFTITVLYNFTGFFSPVNNLPTFNNVNAGRTIPLKFSLSGNKGLSIFAAGYPVSQEIVCDTSAPLSEVEGTETSGGSTLTYSPDTYHYNWKTEGSWATQCRVLTVKLNDGSTHTALFKFK